MNLTNPKVDGAVTSVAKLLEVMDKMNPHVRMTSGTIPVPGWWRVVDHFQGIAPINGLDAITGHVSASATGEWWCAAFEQTSDTDGTVDDVFGTNNYDHAGGIQRIGDILVVPLERPEGSSTVAFYDVSREPVSHPIYEIGVEGKASSVAITNYTDSDGNEQTILFIYQYEPKQFLIYQAPSYSIGQKDGWVYRGVVQVPFPGADDQFQCFSCATQTNNPGGDYVYLLAFREDEELYLYSVNLYWGDLGELHHDGVFTGWTGSEWRWGTGLQIVSPTHIRIYGCSEQPSGDTDDYSFPIYYWGP